MDANFPLLSVRAAVSRTAQNAQQQRVTYLLQAGSIQLRLHRIAVGLVQFMLQHPQINAKVCHAVPSLPSTFFVNSLIINMLIILALRTKMSKREQADSKFVHKCRKLHLFGTSV